ncbi:putative methylated-dna-protein-cysteine methyltransferase [Phaeomoniella chlamydospora]|uniref:Methylated-DNA--protein-cysteine methyltransferase n=1 Tax=Phaeomoniella chlamydospora TaxID=158046 RepID=A0A0G2FTW9_PHACM|nr:putative methylated-dna-protein-cysteine methyltransferase [Phaeomoniella chlamydospora]
MTTAAIEELRSQWKTLYTVVLPAKACAKDSSQPNWPVHLDHCFARIILDDVVGEGKSPWTDVLRAPAINNMSEIQLRRCIELGDEILNGTEDLGQLNEKSLNARGKKRPQQMAGGVILEKESESGAKSKKRTMVPDAKAFDRMTPKKQKSNKQQTSLSFKAKGEGDTQFTEHSQDDLKEKHSIILQRIASKDDLTPYRKRLYSTLLSVPTGRYTTYAAMSDYLKSSARAVGNGMRNNPFAPEVPCHRVLAASGSIGGFGGDWGKDGKNASKKVDLLRNEGVKFDSRGKVYGLPFKDLRDLSVA